MPRVAGPRCLFTTWPLQASPRGYLRPCTRHALSAAADGRDRRRGSCGPYPCQIALQIAGAATTRRSRASEQRGACRVTFTAMCEVEAVRSRETRI